MGARRKYRTGRREARCARPLCGGENPGRVENREREIQPYLGVHESGNAEEANKDRDKTRRMMPKTSGIPACGVEERKSVEKKNCLRERKRVVHVAEFEVEGGKKESGSLERPIDLESVPPSHGRGEHAWCKRGRERSTQDEDGGICSH
ncbi:hypothetical protein KM043_011863 [Ampulex compressa]|nr:hypothetical protein KM043_011863 [Ampulex compressa]